MPRSTPRHLVIGEIIGAHGLRGELKVALETSFPDRFQRLTSVLIGPGDGKAYRSHQMTGWRLHKNNVLLTLADVTDRTTAEEMRGQFVAVPAEQAMPLAEDEYYVHQIEGLQVYTDEGEHLGKVAEVIFTGANEVYVVRSAAGEEVLLPAINDVILDINLDQDRMTVKLLEGLR